MLTASIMAFIQSKKAQLREQKQECLFLCYIVVLPLVGGSAQILNYDYVFLWPFTAAAIFLIFCDFQGRQISVDTLTA